MLIVMLVIGDESSTAKKNTNHIYPVSIVVDTGLIYVMMVIMVDDTLR